MDQITQIIITFLIVILYASAEGINNAILWSRKGSLAYKWNEHEVFIIQRLIFGGALLFHSHWSGLVAGVFAYMYFHNGFYYMCRNQIDGSYPKGFNDYSHSSTARINFTAQARTELFIVSILLLMTAIVLSLYGKI